MQSWINPIDLPDNIRDEDGNGYQDDVNGWNFAEQNNLIIDYKYLGMLDEKIKTFFAYQSKALTGIASAEEMAWLKKQRQDKNFIKKLQIYGNFMHGTHVAGIAARESAAAKILVVKLIPTEVKLPGQKITDKGLGIKLLKKGLGILAQQQMVMLEEIAYYVANHKADVANGSFGTGYAQAEVIIAMLFKTIMRRDPSPAESKELVLHFLNTLIKEGKKMMTAAPATLFVFAAGNDGINNDEFPTSPAGIKSDNSITVAATTDISSLATFSNYGVKTVEVAAPGVAISSTVPGNQYLKVSGTSQAAPYVANIASKVKDANPGLSAKQVKKILMETVDIKGFLKNHVSTSGLVNGERAIRAAEISKNKTLGEATLQARAEIADQTSNGQEQYLSPHPAARNFVLPLPSNFKL